MSLSKIMDKFIDRYEAGSILATYLKKYSRESDTILLALPRGGVPVAFEIAKKLALPLDIFIVRKLGVPGHQEYAMGAIGPKGTVVLEKSIIRELNIEKNLIQQIIKKEQQELLRRERVYRGDRAFPKLSGKKIILVDDGIATGSTMRAAIKALKLFKPTSIIIAVPVASYATCRELEKSVDEIVCPVKPEQFYAVGMWYHDFSQTTDDEVITLLNKARISSDSSPKREKSYSSSPKVINTTPNHHKI
ncbi:MAG TPA: phosphoribosyltransferase [Legionella sp.]|nr:phosphoribosyltransferase [Legionella sp.]